MLLGDRRCHWRGRGLRLGRIGLHRRRHVFLLEARQHVVARGEVEVDAGQLDGNQITRVWLEPAATIHRAVAEAISSFEAIVIGPGSFYTSLMPPLLVKGTLFALAMGLVGGIFPAIRAARLPVSAALREL